MRELDTRERRKIAVLDNEAFVLDLSPNSGRDISIVRIGNQLAQFEALEGFEVVSRQDFEVRGTTGRDVLRGGSDGDIMRGGRGNDEMRNSSGDDEFRGGKGLRDTAVFGRDMADYALVADGSKLLLIRNDTVDTIRKSTEFVQFGGQNGETFDVQQLIAALRDAREEAEQTTRARNDQADAEIKTSGNDAGKAEIDVLANDEDAVERGLQITDINGQPIAEGRPTIVLFEITPDTDALEALITATNGEIIDLFEEFSASLDRQADKKLTVTPANSSDAEDPVGPTLENLIEALPPQLRPLLASDDGSTLTLPMTITLEDGVLKVDLISTLQYIQTLIFQIEDSAVRSNGDVLRPLEPTVVQLEAGVEERNGADPFEALADLQVLWEALGSISLNDGGSGSVGLDGLTFTFKYTARDAAGNRDNANVDVSFDFPDTLILAMPTVAEQTRLIEILEGPERTVEAKADVIKAPADYDVDLNSDGAADARVVEINANGEGSLQTATLVVRPDFLGIPGFTEETPINLTGVDLEGQDDINDAWALDVNGIPGEILAALELVLEITSLSDVRIPGTSNITAAPEFEFIPSNYFVNLDGDDQGIADGQVSDVNQNQTEGLVSATLTFGDGFRFDDFLRAQSVDLKEVFNVQLIGAKSNPESAFNDVWVINPDGLSPGATVALTDLVGGSIEDVRVPTEQNAQFLEDSVLVSTLNVLTIDEDGAELSQPDGDEHGFGRNIVFEGTDGDDLMLPLAVNLDAVADQIARAETTRAAADFEQLTTRPGEGDDVVLGSSIRDLILLEDGNNTALGGLQQDIFVIDGGDNLLVGDVAEDPFGVDLGPLLALLGEDQGGGNTSLLSTDIFVILAQTDIDTVFDDGPGERNLEDPTQPTELVENVSRTTILDFDFGPSSLFTTERPDARVEYGDTAATGDVLDLSDWGFSNVEDMLANEDVSIFEDDGNTTITFKSTTVELIGVPDLAVLMDNIIFEGEFTPRDDDDLPAEKLTIDVLL
ncbi:MAG: hypothetical protein AAFX39_13825 [Pseudomonadota bacterium]